MAEGLTVVPDEKGFATVDAMARAAKDSKFPDPQRASRRFTSARTRLLQAPLSWGNNMREGNNITASIAATQRILERLLAFSITFVPAAVMRSRDGRGTPVEVITLPCLMSWSRINLE